jgi:hypothetical protein
VLAPGWKGHQLQRSPRPAATNTAPAKAYVRSSRGGSPTSTIHPMLSIYIFGCVSCINRMVAWCGGAETTKTTTDLNAGGQRNPGTHRASPVPGPVRYVDGASERKNRTTYGTVFLLPASRLDYLILIYHTKARNYILRCKIISNLVHTLNLYFKEIFIIFYSTYFILQYNIF